MTSMTKNPAAPRGADGADIDKLCGNTDSTDDSATAFAAQAKWRERNPLAVWAQSAARSAIRRGLLEKKPCAVCGNPDTDFHHDPDAYDQPLRGIFLCRRHHKAEHKRLKGGGE